MFQTFSVRDIGKHREIKMEIKSNINFPIFDIILGSILEVRLKQMTLDAIKNIESQIQK